MCGNFSHIMKTANFWLSLVHGVVVPSLRRDFLTSIWRRIVLREIWTVSFVRVLSLWMRRSHISMCVRDFLYRVLMAVRRRKYPEKRSVITNHSFVFDEMHCCLCTLCIRWGMGICLQLWSPWCGVMYCSHHHVVLCTAGVVARIWWTVHQ